MIEWPTPTTDGGRPLRARAAGYRSSEISYQSNATRPAPEQRPPARGRPCGFDRPPQRSGVRNSLRLWLAVINRWGSAFLPKSRCQFSCSHPPLSNRQAVFPFYHLPHLIPFSLLSTTPASENGRKRGAGRVSARSVLLPPCKRILELLRFGGLAAITYRDRRSSIDGLWACGVFDAIISICRYRKPIVYRWRKLMLSNRPPTERSHWPGRGPKKARN